MHSKQINTLIKERLKDIAIRICDLNLEDREWLLAEYKEFIICELESTDIMMLPYEAYTDRIEMHNRDDFI